MSADVVAKATNDSNVKDRLQELLYLLIDECFSIMERARNGDEEVKPAHLQIVRQVLLDQDVSYKDAITLNKAEKIREEFNNIPSFAAYKSKYGKS
jgi:hypothetical protein